MPPDDRGDEMKSLWQNQGAEPSEMTLEMIRQKARYLRAKTRRQLLGTLAAPLTASILYVLSIRSFPLKPMPQLLFASAFVWSLAGLFFLNRGMWSGGGMPEDPGFR